MSLIAFISYSSRWFHLIAFLTSRVVVLQKVNLLDTMVEEVLVLYYFNWWLIRIVFLDVVIRCLLILRSLSYILDEGSWLLLLLDL